MKIKNWLHKNFAFTVIFCIAVILFFSLYNSIKDDDIKENLETNKNWHDNVDIIYYINLDRRTDRNNEILEELYRMGVPESKIQRVSGVYKPGQGDWGCSLSHLKIMRDFDKSNYKNCIIFEDDFTFQSSLKDLNYIFNNFFDSNIDYDVCMLSSNLGNTQDTEYPFILKINNTQTTSGYLVNKKYSKKLLNNYEEGTELIGKSYEKGKGYDIQRQYCIDQYWKRLQDVDNWYTFNPKIGIQRDSFSDIQGEFISYKA
jgi:hypothetical protein